MKDLDALVEVKQFDQKYHDEIMGMENVDDILGIVSKEYGFRVARYISAILQEMDDTITYKDVLMILLSTLAVIN